MSSDFLQEAVTLGRASWFYGSHGNQIQTQAWKGPNPVGNVGRGPRNIELSLIEIVSNFTTYKISSCSLHFKIWTRDSIRCRELAWGWGNRSPGIWGLQSHAIGMEGLNLLIGKVCPTFWEDGFSSSLSNK